MYKHILVAVELSEDSDSLIDKASAYGKQFDAEVSLIYINSAYGEIYSELYDLVAEQNRENVPERTNTYFKRFIERAEVPLKHALVGTGNIGNRLPEIVEEYQVDLLICGHHHDFWSQLVSTARELVNASSIDILVHPI